MPTLQRPDLDFMFNGEFLELSILNQLPSPQLFLLLVWMWTDIHLCCVYAVLWRLPSKHLWSMNGHICLTRELTWECAQQLDYWKAWQLFSWEAALKQCANWNGISIIFGQTVLAPNIFQDIILEKKRKMVGDKDAQSCLTHLPFPLDSFERGTQEW